MRNNDLLYDIMKKRDLIDESIDKFKDCKKDLNDENQIYKSSLEYFGVFERKFKGSWPRINS